VPHLARARASASCVAAYCQNDRLEMTGGRLWKLNQQKFAYELVGQVGDVEKIKPNFSIKVEDYRLFKQLPEQKTILGNETNPYLREKGIKRFSPPVSGNWRR